MEDTSKPIEDNNIIVQYNLDKLGDSSLCQYVAHVYCEEGCCEIGFNGSSFTLSHGKCMIIVNNRFVDWIKPGESLKVMTVFISCNYLYQCVTKSNFGIIGTVRLYSNPIFDLLPEESEICYNNFRHYIERVGRRCHFREDMLVSATQLFFLDFFEFHIRIYGSHELSESVSVIMRRFLKLLDDGDYVSHREVSYYADRLCVVPKYLSEICRKVSGYGATYWITRYAIQDLRNHLRDKSQSVNDIAQKFHFSSVAYFNRYLQKHLGATASELRR